MCFCKPDLIHRNIHPGSFSLSPYVYGNILFICLFRDCLLLSLSYLVSVLHVAKFTAFRLLFTCWSVYLSPDFLPFSPTRYLTLSLFFLCWFSITPPKSSIIYRLNTLMGVIQCRGNRICWHNIVNRVSRFVCADSKYML